jgi:hypothetical protein
MQSERDLWAPSGVTGAWANVTSFRVPNLTRISAPPLLRAVDHICIYSITDKNKPAALIAEQSSTFHIFYFYFWYSTETQPILQHIFYILQKHKHQCNIYEISYTNIIITYQFYTETKSPVQLKFCILQKQLTVQNSCGILQNYIINPNHK